MVIMEMFGSFLGLSVSPSASCFGYSAQLGAGSEPPFWPSLCPPWSTPFQPDGEAVLCSLGTQLEHSASQHCHLDLESSFQSSGSIPYVLITQRLCIQGQVFKGLSTFPTSLCSSMLVPQCLSRMTTVAFMSLRCMLYLHNYSQSSLFLDSGPGSSLDSSYHKVWPISLHVFHVNTTLWTFINFWRHHYVLLKLENLQMLCAE